ncbi:hypothetical protein OEZ86_010152 [Tetradesmus obliquus]|nr:hypothetical protein OEZ86_010152 [Tetradesmus obliquus]
MTAAKADTSRQQDRLSTAAFKKPTAGSPLPTGTYKSQLGQDKYIDDLLHGLTNGFFVESGAHDGTGLSNTLFLEASRNWTGLLVEANPMLFQTLVNTSNRTASLAINACLSPTGKHEELEFLLGGFLGGLAAFMPEYHKQRMRNEIQAAGGEQAAGPTNTGKTVNITCWPLHEIMAALGKTKIDYWSLDTEGSEPGILNATDFSKIEVSVMTVEVNDGEARAKVEKVMATKPFRLHFVLGSDLVYVSNNFQAHTH